MEKLVEGWLNWGLRTVLGPLEGDRPYSELSQRPYRGATTRLTILTTLSIWAAALILFVWFVDQSPDLILYAFVPLDLMIYVIALLVSSYEYSQSRKQQVVINYLNSCALSHRDIVKTLISWPLRDWMRLMMLTIPIELFVFAFVSKAGALETSLFLICFVVLKPVQILFISTTCMLAHATTVRNVIKSGGVGGSIILFVFGLFLGFVIKIFLSGLLLSFLFSLFFDFLKEMEMTHGEVFHYLLIFLPLLATMIIASVFQKRWSIILLKATMASEDGR